MPNTLLTNPQKRSILASLLIFEKALRKADRLLAEGEDIGIFYIRKTHLDTQRRQLIQTKIAEGLSQLRIFSNELGINPIQESLEGNIMAEMSISWESLEESRSKRMSGYGELSQPAIEIIDPVVNQLSKIAMEMINLLSPDLSNTGGQEIKMIEDE